MKIKKQLFAFLFVFLVAVVSTTVCSFDVAFASTENKVFQCPEIITQLDNLVVELDELDNVVVLQPSISFEHDDYVLYDEYKMNNYVTDKTYVVRGIATDGKATIWSTNGFSPSEIGRYELQIQAKVEMYNKSQFQYVEEGYYTNIALGEDVKITFGAFDEHRFEKGSVRYIVKQEAEGIRFFEADEKFVKGEETEQSLVTGLGDFNSIDFELWFQELRLFELKSEVATITVQDTLAPIIKNYDYSNQESMTVESFKENGIVIYGIEATDASGIDFDKSEITIFYKRANGMTGGEYVDAVDGAIYKSTSPNPDGVYTITYKVFDNNGNFSVATYNICVGDTVAPEITLPKDFIQQTLSVEAGLSIDTAEISITDDVTLPDKCDLTVELVETNSGEVVESKLEGTKYIFDLEHKKSYKLSIKVQDKAGNTTVLEYIYDSISVEVKGEGEVNLLPKADLYLRGTKVNVEILAETGWELFGFEGATLDASNSFDVEKETVLRVVFKARNISLSSNDDVVKLDSTMNIVPEGSTVEVENVKEGDQRFSYLKNLLSNPDKLAVFDINLKDSEGNNLTKLSSVVTLKIKLEDIFDANKINVFRVDLTGEKTRLNFVVEDGYIVINTDHFSFYTISQSEGFKPVSPSKDGTNKMGLTLIILGVVGLLAVGVIAGLVFVKRKKN